VSAALQALARALPEREVHLRALAPVFGEPAFLVVVVDGARTRYRVTITGLPDPDVDGAIRLLVAELLREHRDLLGTSDVCALEDLLASLPRAL
jgi:hypothetical protein